MELEVLVIPVSDVARAKEFYANLRACRIDSAETSFASAHEQAGVSLHEQSGFYAGGDDIQLVPDSRQKFGDFVVHILKSTHGFAIAEGSARAPGSDGIRWDDALANHRPPYYTSFKRYGPSLELQWSSGHRSTRQAQWQQLDAILTQLSSLDDCTRSKLAQPDSRSTYLPVVRCDAPREWPRFPCPERASP